MKGELPVLYCKHCGRKLRPNWYEGYEGRIQYDTVDGKPYREYEVFYSCPVKWDFWKFHSYIKHVIRKLANSDYRLPQSVKEYNRLN